MIVLCLLYLISLLTTMQLQILLIVKQYRREIGAFYNRSSKITFVNYCYKFNNFLMRLVFLKFSCLAFYVVISINTLKNFTGSVLKLSTISLYLLISYSFLTQLWIYSHCISLRGDMELNPGPKQD